MDDKKISKEEQERLLIEIMKYDQELGLYEMSYSESNSEDKDC